MPTNSAKSLQDLKTCLYKAFNKAMDGMDNISYYETDKIEKAAKTISSISERIEAVGHEIAMLDTLKELREKGGDLEIDMGKGLLRSITPLSKIKLKGT